MHVVAHLSRCLHTSSVADTNFCPAVATGAAAQQLLQSSASSACTLPMSQLGYRCRDAAASPLHAAHLRH
jgi:hypothetical protein